MGAMINQDDFVLLPGGSIGQLAIYRPQTVLEYKGNPVIEALPPLKEKGEVVEFLESYPPHRDKDRELPPHVRMHLVMGIFKYFQPWGRHFDLEQRFSIALRQGYKHRNPNNPLYRELLQKEFHSLKNGQMFYNYADRLDNQAAGFTIIGFSGMGKSKAIERVLSMYKQIIVHSEYDGSPLNFYQLSWLKLECPFDGSVKALCCNFLQSIDQLLGTSYYKENGSGGWTSMRMLPGMKQAAQNHYLGALIVDEIQCLSQAKSGGAAEMLNFFVTLVNMIGLPVILIGTTKALPVLQGEFRQARRGSGMGDMVWDQLKNDSIWKMLITGAWKYQWTKTKVDINDNFIDLLYEESQGIIDIAIKIYAVTQFRAIALGGAEIITEELIKKVSRDSFQLVRPMLDALKSGDPKLIVKYQDIIPIDIQGYLEQYYAKLNEKKAKQEALTSIAKDQRVEKDYHDLVSKLLELDVDLIVAKKVAKKTIGLLADKFEANTALKKAFKLAIELEMKPQKRGKAPPNIELFDEDDLRLIKANAKKIRCPTYELLQTANYIKDPLEELLINMG